MASRTASGLLLLVVAAFIVASSAARLPRGRAGGDLASNLETLRRRLVASDDGFGQAGAARDLLEYPYPGGSYGYGYYYGYYSYGASPTSYRRRSLLSIGGADRDLLEYPYPGGAGASPGYYYGYYYGYSYGSASASGYRRRLSTVDRLSDVLNSDSDGFVKPGSKSEIDEILDSRRSLLQYPYGPGAGSYGYYYGYYYGY